MVVTIIYVEVIQARIAILICQLQKNKNKGQERRRNAALLLFVEKSLDLWKVLWYVFVLQKEVQRT